MKFVIGGLKYDTERMQKIADVKKWYETTSVLLRMACKSGEHLGRMQDCELWKGKNGHYLLTHAEDYKTYGEAIKEEEAKSLMMRYATDEYEEMFGELPEA